MDDSSTVPPPRSARGDLRAAILSPTVWMIVILVGIGGGLSHYLTSHDLRDFRESLGPMAMAVTLPIHVVLALTPFPSDFVAIANGAMYGFAVGTPLSCFGWWIAAIIQFWIGRRARSDLELESVGARLPQWLRRLPDDHPLYLMGVRQVPWLGMHLGSFVPGAAGVPFRRFLWCSAFGVIPGSLLMTAIGAGLVHWASTP